MFLVNWYVWWRCTKNDNMTAPVFARACRRQHTFINTHSHPTVNNIENQILCDFLQMVNISVVHILRHLWIIPNTNNWCTRSVLFKTFVLIALCVCADVNAYVQQHISPEADAHTKCQVNCCLCKNTDINAEHYISFNYQYFYIYNKHMLNYIAMWIKHAQWMQILQLALVIVVVSKPACVFYTPLNPIISLQIRQHKWFYYVTQLYSPQHYHPSVHQHSIINCKHCYISITILQVIHIQHSSTECQHISIYCSIHLQIWIIIILKTTLLTN